MNPHISVMEELSIFMHRFRISDKPEEKDFVFTLLYTLIYLEKLSPPLSLGADTFLRIKLGSISQNYITQSCSTTFLYFLFPK